MPASGALRTPESEFHHRPLARRAADFGGFRGDQRLVIDNVEKRRFRKLRLNERRLDRQDGFCPEIRVPPSRTA